VNAEDQQKKKEEEKKEELTGGQEALYASTAVPKDDLFARVMVDMLPKWIVGYHKSEEMIEGEKELDPEEVLYSLLWLLYQITKLLITDY